MTFTGGWRRLPLADRCRVRGPNSPSARCTGPSDRHGNLATLFYTMTYGVIPPCVSHTVPRKPNRTRLHYRDRLRTDLDRTSVRDCRLRGQTFTPVSEDLLRRDPVHFSGGIIDLAPDGRPHAPKTAGCITETVGDSHQGYFRLRGGGAMPAQFIRGSDACARLRRTFIESAPEES